MLQVNSDLIYSLKLELLNDCFYHKKTFIRKQKTDGKGSKDYENQNTTIN